MTNILKIVKIKQFSFTFFSETDDEVLFGWYESDKSPNDTGFSVTGSPWSVSRAKYSTIEKAEDDLSDHLRYNHSINRVESFLIIKGE